MEYLLVIIGFLIISIYVLLLKLARLTKILKKLKFDKQSQSVKYGKMSEQFMPFLNDFPYDSQNFRFIGTPIDGMVFEDGKIIFVEFKTATSKLSQKQKQIKESVQAGNVEFLEFSIK